jgi:hypothetical protein
MNKHKLLDCIGWTFLVTTIVLLKLANRLLDNVINAKVFLFEFGIYGTILSAVILYVIYRTTPDYYKGGENRASALLSYFFGMIAIFVFGSACYNLETARKNIRSEKAYVSDKLMNVRYTTHYLILQLNDREEKFQPLKKEWDCVKKNDTILLTVGHGKLGYDYIFNFVPN